MRPVIATQSVATRSVRPWVWTTPFGLPVVPDVNKMSDGSSGPSASERRRTSALASSVARARNWSQPSLRPVPALRARTTVPRAGSSSARASAMAAWSVPRKSATVTSTRAPLRDRISRTSAALNRVLTGTSTAPAWKVPRAATIHSAQLYAQMATRSPGSVPAATRADAKASASAASSP